MEDGPLPAILDRQGAKIATDASCIPGPEAQKPVERRQRRSIRLRRRSARGGSTSIYEAENTSLALLHLDDGRWHWKPFLYRDAEVSCATRRWLDRHHLADLTFRTKRDALKVAEAVAAIEAPPRRPWVTSPESALRRVAKGVHETRDGDWRVEQHGVSGNALWLIFRKAEHGYRRFGAADSLHRAQSMISAYYPLQP